MKNIHGCLVLVSIVLGSLSANAETNEVKVIYGDDNRLDLFQVTDNKLMEAARSTVGLIQTSALRNDSVSGEVRIAGSKWQTRANMCVDEPFSQQTSAAFCSGSLVGPNLIMTAGHCIENQSDCNSTAFMFDFAVTEIGGDGPSRLPRDNVYFCKKIRRSQVIGSGADYAVIEIDRPVVGRTPLEIDRTASIQVGDPLVVIGHPAGLPTKVSGGANVRRIVGSDYLVANLDTYGGNSGSAVFSEKTGAIVGILVRGETDYIFRGGCRVSNICQNESCRGEDVTLVGNAVPFIDAIAQGLR